MNQVTPTESSVMILVKKMAVRTCCVFTAVTLILLMIQWIMEAGLQKSINVTVFLMLLPLSLTIAAAGMIRGSEKLSVGSKIFWHPLLCLSGIFLTYLPYMTANKFPGGTVMVHLVFFAFIYGIVTAVVCFIASLMKDKKPGKIPAPYVSQFRRDNENRKDK
ncbi:MAG: hypothetical protein E7645_02525 [Ruminococcaceae bacterium]|nr:hypothetical protein [Oscillospiraceae bacterium]